MIRLWLLMLFMGFYTATLAQEICGNGLDDDGNGKVDCFDTACANTPECDGSFIGQDKDCQTDPPPSEVFQMTKAFVSSQSSPVTTSFDRIVVGDLDGDGFPEVVTPNYNTKRVYILDGRDLTTKQTITPNFSPERYDLAIADIDGDGCGEIFIASKRTSDGTYYIEAFNCTGGKLASWGANNYRRTRNRPYDISLADFDGDGKVEIYYRNEIMAAENGNILVAGTGDWTTTVDGGPVAADILPASPGLCVDCDGLELVSGGTIYSVKLSPTLRTAASGSMTVVRNINDLIVGAANKYFPNRISCCGEGGGFINSQTSIADLNEDGNLDVLMNGASGTNTYDNSPLEGEPTIFYWDVIGNNYFTYKPKQTNNTSWQYGTGRLNVAELDTADNVALNVTFVSGNQLFALSPNFTTNTFVKKWSKTIDEESSGFTSTTVFDFNNDGASEIVYRDESELFIIKGKDGSDYTKVPCLSQTTNEYPVVVDVDNDGATEICITCAIGDNAANVMTRGEVRMYKSFYTDDPWVPARKVWNQHAYFNVNVNDDLTIPKVQQKHHVVFSTGQCGPGENRALNSFLNQSAILDSKGCKTYPAPDIIFQPDPVSLINITPPTCPSQNFTASFKLRNQGNIAMSGPLKITFYSGDPRAAGAVRLNTITTNLVDLRPDSVFSVSNITINGTGKVFTLYAILNDDGTMPIPFANGIYPNSSFNECTYSNNVVFASVNPGTFPVTTASTDHIQCGVTATPANGSAEAYKLEGTDEVTVGYTFYWFNGATVGDTTAAAFKGPVRSPLVNGTYSVLAVHNAFRCGSAPATVNVGLQTRTISATVTVDKDFTNCKNPDGKLTVNPDGGEPIGNFTYEWFEGTVFGTSPTLSTSHVLTGAEATTYSVLITEISTNCQTIESGTVADLTVKPVVAATTTPTGCNPNNTGTASANVGGDVSSYDFSWYDGNAVKAAPDFPGATYPSLTAGEYTVTAKDNSTGCTSNPFVVVVGSPAGITASASVTAQQTSCTTPNGTASANVGGATAGFSFKWFQGNNTLAINQIGTNANVTGLAAGQYTVEATRNADGCVDTELITVVDQILYPTVSPSVTAHQTNCAPPNGSVTATAGGTPGPHTIYWFNGNVGVPDTTAANFKGATYTGRAAGFYTVLAVNKITRCPSARGVVEVLNNTSNPVISTASVNQTSCIVGSPNGQASANIAGVTAGFKFRWFPGTDTTSLPMIAQAISISNRASGSYTVKAVNLTTGCFSTRVVAITEASANPVLSLNKSDNTICNATLGFNGSVTSSITSNPNALPGHTFIYEWSKDAVVMAGETSSSINGLNGATYEVTMRNQTLGCESDPVSIEVDDVFALPVLTTTFTSSTNCVPGKENGSADVTNVDGVAVGAAIGYTYQWHTGAGTGSPILVGTNATADDPKLNMVQGGAANNYTVLVTNQTTGCQNTATVLVGDAKVLPSLTMSATDNSVCDPTLTSAVGDTYNGTVTATVSNQVGALADYTFAFGAGMVAGTPDVLPNHNRYLNLNGGATAYTATATHNPTGCVSAPAGIVVQNAQDLPDLTTSSDGSTNCVPAGGAVVEDGVARVVTVDTNPATTVNFSFAWTGPALFDVSGNATNNDIELQNLQGGAGYDYTVLVTNLLNGCQNTAVVNVADEKVLPALTLSATDNSICDPTLTSTVGDNYNGTVTATVSNQVGALTNYTFAFGAGMVAGTPDVSPNHNRYLNLNGGATAYTVTATHTLTGCVSAQASIQVQNAQDLPDLTTSSDGSTNCVPAGGAVVEDGMARVVTVDTNPATTVNFSFAWTGPALFDVSGNATNNDIELQNLQGGVGYDYTVLVTNLLNGCQNTAVVNVADQKVLPALTLSATDNSICDPTLTSAIGDNYNGTVTATVTNQVGALTNYTFAFGAGMVAGTPDVSPNHNRYLNLNGGATAYTVTATHTLTGCVSAQASIQVQNAQDLPDLTTSSDGSTNCVPAGGAVVEDGMARVVTVDTNPATTVNFSFAWTGPALFDVSGNATNNDIELQNLQGGAGYDYTVVVTNQLNGCQNTAIVNVADEKVLPLISLTSTDNGICDPALTSAVGDNYNGTVTASVTNLIGALTDYDFTFGAGEGPGITNGNVYEELDGGATAYTAFATHVPTGCVSATGNILVANVQDIPDLTLASDPSKNCDPLLEDGKARVVTVDGVAATTLNFSYAWNGPVAPLFSVAGNVTNDDIELQNVQGGIGYNYAVLVTNLLNGCTNTSSVNVADAKVLPLITLAPGSLNTICDPALTPAATDTYNGTVVATVTNQIGLIGDYSFAFGGGAGTPVANTFTELNGGINYTVTVTHTPTGCDSNVASTLLNNNLTYPVLVTDADGSTNCIPSQVNGAAYVTEVDGLNTASDPAALTDYTYQWYNGNTVIAGNIRATDTNPTLGSTAPGFGLQGGLPASTFTILVTANSDGCQSNSAVTIPDAKANPVISVSLVNNNTMCVGADGSLTAAVTYKTVLQTSPLDPNWTVTWSNAFVGETVAGLSAGNYSATVTDSNTGCTSTPDAGTIVDDFDLPVITNTVLNNQTSCDVIKNGEIQGNATNGPALSTLEFSWYTGIGTGGVQIATSTGNVSGGALLTPDDLDTQNYTFEARNEVTGCTSTSSIFLPEQLTTPEFTGVVTDVTQCVPTNGELEITLTAATFEDPTQFTIYYLNETNFGQTGDPAFIISNATLTDNSTLTYIGIVGGHELVPGTYTVLVEDDITKCQSNPQTFTVDDNTVKTISASFIAASSFCSSNDGGELQLTITPPGAYTYSWHRGVPSNNNFDYMNNANRPDFSPAGTITASTASTTITGVGTSFTTDLSMDDKIYDATGTVEIGQVASIIDNFTLTLTANATQNLGGSAYVTFLQTSQNLEGEFDGTTTGVTNGIYSVEVIDGVGCGKVFSETVPFQGAPDIDVTTNHSTLCDPLTSDASIEVTVDGTAFGATNYSVRLFSGTSSLTGLWIDGEDDLLIDGIDNDGDGFTDGADTNTGTNAAAFSTTFSQTSAALTGSANPLLNGDYLVRVFDILANCAVEKIVTIEIASKLPVFTLNSLVASTACTGGVGDGEVEISLERDPLDKIGTAGYPSIVGYPNYQVTAIGPALPNGGAVPQVIPESTPTTITGGFEAQLYDLTIRETNSGCEITRSVNVPSNPGNATAMAFTATNDDYCAPLTGGSALVTSILTPAPSAFTDFQFVWYKNNDLTGAVYTAMGDGANAGGELLDDSKVAVADWSLGANGSGNPNKIFYVRGQKQNGPGDKCFTPLVQVEIKDTHSAPQINLTPFSNTSCNALAPEGRIQILTSTTSPAVPAIQNATYTYSWLPASAPSPDAGENGAAVYTISGLAANTYTITALNEVSSCISENAAEVLDTKFDILVTDNLATPQDICPVGGRIDVTDIEIDRSITGEATIPISGPDLSAEFTYQWFKAPAGNPGTFNAGTPLTDNVPNPIDIVSLISGTNPQEYASMGTGTYYVIATRTNSVTYPGALCPSQPFRIDVGDERVYPTVSFPTVVGNSACDANFDGQITVAASTASGPGALANYNFVWTNDPDAGAAAYSASNSATNNTVSPFSTVNTDLVGSGQYTIRVTNFATQCFTDANVTVPNAVVPMAIVTINATPVDVCAPVNGEGTVAAVEVDGNPGNTGDFTYTWADNSAMLLPFVTDNAAVTQSNLDIGTYYITAKMEQVISPVTPGVSGSGCVSPVASFTVLDEREFPTVSFATLASTSCNTEYDGQITVTATTTGFGGATLYDFDWTGNPGGSVVITDAMNVVSAPVFSSEALGGPLLERIGPGTYNITVTNKSNNCPSLASVTVAENKAPIEVTTFNTTPLTDCTNDDGEVEITGVNVAGVPAVGLGDFSFAWTGPGGPYAGVNPVSNADFGDYFATVTKTAITSKGSGCSSAPFKVTVLDERKFPTVSFATLASTSCNTEYDGQITVTATTTGFGGATLYDFDWTGPGGAVVITDAMNVVSAPVFSSEALGGPLLERIGPGTYNITVTNKSNNCPSLASVTVTENKAPIEVTTFNTTPLTHCTNDDGEVEITGVNVAGVPAVGLGDFSFAWTGPGGPYAGVNPVSNADFGDYFATVTKTAITSKGSGCSSAPFKVTVLDERKFPTVSFATLASTSCNTQYDGEITVTATTTGFGGATLYDFDWTGNPGGAVVITDAMGVTSARIFRSEALGGPLLERIGPGTYNITVTNNSNDCPRLASVIVQENKAPIEVTTFNTTPLTHCTNDDGEVEITGVNVAGVPAVGLGDFSFAWTGPGGPYAGVNPVSNADFGDYFATVTKTAITSKGSGCSSAPFKVTVLDERKFPTISFATLANTSCDNNFDGEITVTATTTGFGGATLYDFDWTSNPVGTVITDGMGVVSARINRSESLGGPLGERIGAGAYGITVRNTLNQCPTIGSVTVQQNTAPVEILTATTNPQQRCVVPGDGSVAVALADVRVNGAAVAGGITFGWEDNGGNPVGAGLSVNNLVAGFYFVEATRTSGLTKGSGCVSQPLRVEVKDLRQFPVVTFATVENTSCDTNFDGEITVTAATTGLGAVSNYSFDWTSNPGGAVVINDAMNNASPYTTTAADNIGAGSYDISVINLTTSCQTDATVTVIQNTPVVEILDVTKLDQTDCAPFNGSITVDGTNPAHVSTTGTYTFTWRKGAVALPTPSPDNILSQIDAGTYFVTGTKTDNIGSGCVTSDFPVNINSAMPDAAIDIVSLANIACNTNYTGQISATVSEGNTQGITAGYNFEWFRGLNTTNLADFIVSATSLSNQQHGDYTVRVTDTATPGNGCVSTATLPILFAPTEFQSALSSVMQTLCAPTQDGSLQVNTISETIEGVTTNYDMATGDLALFSFQWFDDASAPLTGIVNGDNTLTNRLAGQYYVQITNALGCTSTFTGEVIEDQTATPVIGLEDFLNPTVCLLPETPGHLLVSADNSLNFSDYTFEWFEGADTSGPQVVADNPGLNNIMYTAPQVYTVQVTNKATNCFSLETYRFATDTVAIRVIASAVPLNSCTTNNGSLFAAVQEGNGNLYNYEWYSGNVVGTTPDFTTKEVLTAPLGVFTVIAINPLHNFCPSESSTTEVTDGRIYPPVDIEQKNPLTYCDPANPNGVAKATVLGGVLGYTFEWFEGPVAGTPFYTGSEVDRLKAVTYTVQATDAVSGCNSTKSILIANEPLQVPSPAVIIISHLTDCVNDNGELRGHVDENRTDYTIQWYTGSATKTQTDADGEFYSNLADGMYTTTATHVVSGCISDPVLTEVLPFKEDPDFEVLTVPTNCEANIGEATFVPLNDVPIASIIWNIDGNTYSSTAISELPKGEFSVIATSVAQCTKEVFFEILPEILVFNGVSRNGDGQNDIFELSCIEDFPNNTVKIFNRAGTLVYQGKGYNNNDIAFDGTSNEGLSLMGRELPDGTYFYIIDKGNGARPTTGYLELLRD